MNFRSYVAISSYALLILDSLTSDLSDNSNFDIMSHKQIGMNKPYFRFLLIKHSIISTFVISHIFAMALIFLGIKPKYTTIYPTDLLM